MGEASMEKKITGEKIRLDKMLGNLGIGTRKEIKALVRTGVVTVNGEIVKDSSSHVMVPQDVVEIEGTSLNYRKFVYLMMHKPAGVVSATRDNRDETVVDLLDEEYWPFEVFPVGRLDKDTEGLLLLTNDGQLAHNLLSPKKHVMKTYYAKINGEVTQKDVTAFGAGVVLEDGYKTLPAQLEILASGSVSEVKISIQEGKFHQIKRMFIAVDKEVTYLKRLTMGTLELDPTLPLGEYRELTEEELTRLQ